MAPSSSARAAAGHHSVRGVANTSAACPNAALYLSQANPEALVDPVQYFHQIGDSILKMRAANDHMRERIQQVRVNPTTMDQDVRLVIAGARPFEPYLCFPIGDGDDSEDGRTMEDYSARDNPESVSHEALRGSVRVIGSPV